MRFGSRGITLNIDTSRAVVRVIVHVTLLIQSGFWRNSWVVTLFYKRTTYAHLCKEVLLLAIYTEYKPRRWERNIKKRQAMHV